MISSNTTEATEPEGFLATHKHTLFVIAVFVVVFVSARLAIHPINDSDYRSHIEALRIFLNGHSPYLSVAWYYPPWSLFILAPLAQQPIETWLALTIALFVATVFDMGKPSGLLLLAHPVFIALVASSNAEWIFLGPGFLLLHHMPKGWGRGLAWLFLTCKPQSSALFLLVDGWQAVRERDWKAIGLAAGVAFSMILMYPDLFRSWSSPFTWSGTVLSNFGIIGSILVTIVIVAIRWKRLGDRKTLAILLAPVWSLYMIEYSYMATVFTLRSAGWLRVLIYVAASIGLAALFWQNYHAAEQYGLLGMVLLAAILAPTYLPKDSGLKPALATTNAGLSP